MRAQAPSLAQAPASPQAPPDTRDGATPNGGAPNPSPPRRGGLGAPLAAATRNENQETKTKKRKPRNENRESDTKKRKAGNGEKETDTEKRTLFKQSLNKKP